MFYINYGSIEAEMHNKCEMQRFYFEWISRHWHTLACDIISIVTESRKIIISTERLKIRISYGIWIKTIEKSS